MFRANTENIPAWRFCVKAIALFLCLSFSAAAQDKHLDSLEVTLIKTQNDSNRVNLLNKLGRGYYLLSE